MSSKLKLKSNAGGSVSLVVDDILATDEEVEITSAFGIESGSNANGSWTKFPDGTLICIHSDADDSGSTIPWTYPVPFTEVPVVQIAFNGSTPGYYSVQVSSILTASCSYIKGLTSGVATTDGINVQLTAIGRWK